MTTEIAKFNFEITSMKEAMEYAKMIADSDLAPKDYKGKVGNVIIAMQYGFEVGLKPMQAIQNIAVINGRPAIWGDAMIALVQNHPICEYIKEDIINDVASCAVKRRGEEEHVSKFSIDDAKKAGLWGKPGPWTQYPQRMLQMRARAFALRDKFSDVLKGMAMREEVMDYAETDSQNVKVTVAQNKIAQLIDNKKPPVVILEIENEKFPQINLGKVLNNIDNANNIDDLEKISVEAHKLNENDKGIARAAFIEKKRQLSTINKETGEIVNPEVQSSHLTEYDKIKKQLLSAKSRDTLDIAADLIISCENESEKEELLKIYNDRKDQVK